MPVFKEYTATGKLTPVDMGFTAFETAARRQQSVAAEQGNVAARAARTGQDIAKSDIEQAANAVAGAKATSLAWDGLKFGLDEMELVQKQQERGGGGVKQGSAKVERTLIGTGSGGDTNWNAKANASNELSRGTADLAAKARGLNNNIAPPVTAKNGIIDPNAGPGGGNALGQSVSPSVGTLHGGTGRTGRFVDPGGLVKTGGFGTRQGADPNPDMIPGLIGPGDVTVEKMRDFGINPDKTIIRSPLEAGFETGAGQGLDAGVVPLDGSTPFAKSGNSIWRFIFGDPNAGKHTDPVGQIGDTMTPSGYDKQGVPFYGTTESPLPKSTSQTLTPASADDTGIPSPATAPDDSSAYNPPDASSY